MKLRALVPAGLLMIPAVAGGWILHDLVPSDGAKIFAQVMSLVKSNAVDPLTEDEVYERAARGLVDELGDAYADLYSPEEIAAFNRESLGAAYGGLGMLIESQEGVVTVTRVFPGTPAERGGVMAGDRIVRVGDKTTLNLKIEDVSKMLLGPVGTQVKVTFARAGTAGPMEGMYTRAQVQRPAVPFAVVIGKDIGYIPLQRFSENSANEVRTALVKLSEQGAKSFVLDLRGNGGGSVAEALTISNLFLERGQEIAQVRFRGKPEETSIARNEPVSRTEPLVILIDPFTASASEIVTGALQDHDRALVVGTTSFGKGLVQEIYTLQDQWALKMTVGKWYTPAGRTIQMERDDNGAPIDSIAKIPRPEYKSDAGRTVYGGGGIVPDVKALPDTMPTTESDFVRALGARANAVYVAVYDQALAVKNTVKPGFRIEPSWRDAVFAHLQKNDVAVTRTQFDEARSLIDRLLQVRIATLAFGDGAAFSLTIPDDAPVRTAISLLEKGRTQSDLFALASSQKVGQTK
jgi:carboxyl-terminal processing protease